MIASDNLNGTMYFWLIVTQVELYRKLIGTKFKFSKVRKIYNIDFDRKIALEILIPNNHWHLTYTPPPLLITWLHGVKLYTWKKFYMKVYSVLHFISKPKKYYFSIHVGINCDSSRRYSSRSALAAGVKRRYSYSRVLSKLVYVITFYFHFCRNPHLLEYAFYIYL